MDKQINECANKWINWQTDEVIYKWIYVCVKRMGERHNERMSKRMNRCKKEQMNEWEN